MKIFKCAVYLMICGILSFLLGRTIPKEWFRCDSRLFRCRDWEMDGKWYQRIHIRKWQKRLPDMSKILPGVMPPKALGNCTDSQEVEAMIQETCVAEFIHLLLIVAGLGCLLIWPGIGGVLVATCNTLGNLLFIWVQRYNRPRLERLYERLCQEVNV